MNPVRDLGLQAERTTLAWRRTALTTLAALCATTHLITGGKYELALLIGLLGTALVLVIARSAHHRPALFRVALTQLPIHQKMNSGLSMAITSGLTASLGMLAGLALAMRR